MIPASQHDAVARALLAAFGTPDAEDVTPVTGGLSTALVFRIVVHGEASLLRLVAPGTVARGDPARQFACMRIAADAGLAPRIRYASVEDQLLLTEFVERQPYPADVAVRMAGTLRRLHALEGFPAAVDYLKVMDGLVSRFRTSGLLPEAVAADFFRGYDHVSRVYPRQQDQVASHNDLKSDNILFDGTRLQLVDWEAAFVNDRYADLAWASTFFVHDEATETAYLQTYFDAEVSDYARARFFLMRQLLHSFAVAFVLPLVVRAGLAVDVTADVPDFREFHQHWIDRKVTLEDMAERRDYALVHLHRMLADTQSERFREALAVVADNAPR